MTITIYVEMLQVTFKDWHWDEPKHIHDCGMMAVKKRKIWSWYSEPCDNPHPYICEFDRCICPGVFSKLSSIILGVLTSKLLWNFVT